MSTSIGSGRKCLRIVIERSGELGNKRWPYDDTGWQLSDDVAVDDDDDDDLVVVDVRLSDGCAGSNERWSYYYKRRAACTRSSSSRQMDHTSIHRECAKSSMVGGVWCGVVWLSDIRRDERGSTRVHSHTRDSYSSSSAYDALCAGDTVRKRPHSRCSMAVRTQPTDTLALRITRPCALSLSKALPRSRESGAAAAALRCCVRSMKDFFTRVKRLSAPLALSPPAVCAGGGLSCRRVAVVAGNVAREALRVRVGI